MNKRETISRVAEVSGVNEEDTLKVIDALEFVIEEEISNSKGKATLFDTAFQIMTRINNRRKSNTV